MQMQVSDPRFTNAIQFIQLLCDNSGVESLPTYSVRPTQIQDQTDWDDLVGGLFDQTGDNVTSVLKSNYGSLKNKKYCLVHTACLM